MKKYRKRPLVIEAVKCNEFMVQEILDWMNGGEVQIIPGIGLFISTLEGQMICKNGDYIIKGIKGEFYPCNPDIFETTYEEVE
jgi:hypothetical protein